MPNTYTLKIKNQTGGKQDYAFFAKPPTVSGGMSGPIWTNVMKAAPNTPNGAVAGLELSTDYYAICGSYEGSPTQGGRINISKTVKVDLGSSNGGNISMGSTIGLTVYDGASADLGPPTTPGAGKLGCFQLDTSTVGKPAENQFTLNDAQNNHVFVGIANAKDADILQAMGTFNPYPNAKYQIQPQATLYVSAGERFKAGDFVKVEQLAQTMAVDFNVRGTNSVTLVHTPENTFVFE